MSTTNNNSLCGCIIEREYWDLFSRSYTHMSYLTTNSKRKGVFWEIKIGGYIICPHNIRHYILKIIDEDICIDGNWPVWFTIRHLIKGENIIGVEVVKKYTHRITGAILLRTGLSQAIKASNKFSADTIKDLENVMASIFVKPSMTKIRYDNLIDDFIESPKDFIIQEKLDGCRGFLKISEDTKNIFTRRNVNITDNLYYFDDDLNKIKEKAKQIISIYNDGSLFGGDILLDGELYIDGVDRSSISGILLKKHTTESKIKMNYHIFDIWHPTLVNCTYLERFNLIKLIIEDLNLTYVGIIKNYVINPSKKESDLIYNQIKEDGGEGVVVKLDETMCGKNCYKFKYLNDENYYCHTHIWTYNESQKLYRCSLLFKTKYDDEFNVDYNLIQKNLIKLKKDSDAGLVVISPRMYNLTYRSMTSKNIPQHITINILE